MGPALSLGGGAVPLEVPLGAEQGLAQGGVLWGRDCASSCLGPLRLLEAPAGNPIAFPQCPFGYLPPFLQASAQISSP